MAYRSLNLSIYCSKKYSIWLDLNGPKFLQLEPHDKQKLKISEFWSAKISPKPINKSKTFHPNTVWEGTFTNANTNATVQKSTNIFTKQFIIRMIMTLPNHIILPSLIERIYPENNENHFVYFEATMRY